MFTIVLMPKSLGMIHTVNYELQEPGPGIVANQKYLIDLPGQLTNQLQRMVRANQYFKVVGIDMTLRVITGGTTLDPAPVAGTIEYYAPTVGRCNAIKEAYKAIRSGMKLMGINVHGNRHYDCRFPLGLTTQYVNGAEFLNQATIDGTNMLTLDTTAASVTDEVFTVYNSNIQPDQTATVDFSAGFGLPGSGTSTDFVLNEGEYYEGSLVHNAELEKESIPFLLSYGIDTTTNTTTAVDMEWRPDPALYLAVLTGQFEVTIKSSPLNLSDYVIDMAIHVSGWKSILGSGKKRRSSKKAKSNGPKRSSKK